MLLNNCRFFAIAAALVALGITATAQQSAALNTPGFIGMCKAMLPENYPALPDEIRALTGEGAMACIRSFDDRTAAQEKLESAAKNLTAAIADKKCTGLDIIRLKLDYLDAFVGIHAADRAMHEPNFAATLKYFDLYIARKKAGTPLDNAAQDAYGKWQKAILAAENHSGPDKELLAKAQEAQRTRANAETAEFKAVIRAMDEMMRRDNEMMERSKDFDRLLAPPPPSTKKQ